MPSASAKLEKQTSIDSNDPVKQVITVVEKKVRNLEKRKSKLDSYKSDSAKGKELNEDQKKAVEKYDLVVELLDFAKDLQKQFQTVIQECTKAQRKAAKQELLERQQLERQRIKEFLTYQDLLSNMGSDDIRQDFLAGNKGAVKLSEEELNSIDELYKIICPERDPEAGSDEFESLLAASTEHIQSLLDAKNKEAFGSTYKSLREILQKILSCSYFNKSEVEGSAEEEEEETQNQTEENDDQSVTEQYANESETYAASQAEDFLITQKNDIVPTQVEVSAPPAQPYYQIESSSLYTEQPHPIQEVLSVQGNLNFLQESQIEIEAATSSHVEPQVQNSFSGVSYPNVEFSPTSQTLPPTLAQQQQPRPRRTSEEASSLTNHQPNANLTLANTSAIQQHQQQPNIPPSVSLQQPTTQPVDFDPARPIPTQTYTNQSFSSAIHPMMAVPPNYVPASLPHTISPAHVLPANMVMPQQQQPLPQRSSVTSTPNIVNPNSLPISAAHTSVSGLSTASTLPQQASIYSLCLKMNQLGSENSQGAHVSPPQYECSEISDSNMNKPSPNTFGNGGDAHNMADSRSRAGSNPYVRAPNQIDYRNDRAYQSTNNNQAYMNRETYADNSSYSSNLKRGLSSRAGPRNTGAPRTTSNPRGGRVGYRN